MTLACVSAGAWRPAHSSVQNGVATMPTTLAQYHDTCRVRIRQAMADGAWQTVSALTAPVFGHGGRDPQRLRDLLHAMLDDGEVEVDLRPLIAPPARYRLRHAVRGTPTR
jgi:hypothetical protein